MATVGDALALAKRGFRVFPLRPNDWRPQIKGWVEAATTDEEAIQRWWSEWPAANVGVATGQGLVVIDVDNKNGADGSKSFRDLGLGRDGVDTYTVKTPTGGFHVYYRGLDVANSAHRLGPGLDVRGAGGYVVGAGSTLPDGVKNPKGGTYAELVDAGARDVPAALAPRLRPADQDRARDALHALADDVAARAVQFLKERAPRARQGAGGDHTTFVVACELKDLGLPEGHALDLLLEHWNEECEPPWAPEDLAVKVANAYRYGENQPGSKDPLVGLEPVELPPLPAPVTRPASNIFWHGTARGAAPRWLFYETIPATGVCVLVGETQSGKTFLELEMARCGATGKPFFKIDPDERYGTIFVFAGTEGSGWAQRLDALQESEPLPIGALHVAELNKPGTLTALLDDLRGAADYMQLVFGVRLGCVVLETLSAAGLLPRENDASDAANAIRNLAVISNELGALVMTTHHPAKGKEDSRGSSAIPSNADYVLNIRRVGREKVRHLDLAVARNAEQRMLGSFSLLPVVIGKDDRGREIRSLVVSTGPAESQGVKSSKHAPLLVECIEWARMENSRNFDDEKGVDRNDVWKVFKERLKTPADESNKHKAFKLALTFLEEQGVVEFREANKLTYIILRELFT